MTDATENQVHEAVVEYLTLRKYLFWHVPNESKSHISWRRKLARMGTLPGVPDISLILPGGQAAFMEIKSPTGRLSPAQRAFRDAATKLGAKWSVVRSVGDAATALELWG